MYLTSSRECPGVIPELKGRARFQELSYEDQKKILDYGSLRKRWGMGCYQENGTNAEMYSRGIPTKNPFESKQNDRDENEGER